MRRSFLLGTGLAVALVLAPFSSSTRTLSFPEPIDALSFTVESEEHTVDVRGRLSNGSWTPWQTLLVETEFDPLLRETALAMFPEPVDRISIRTAAPVVAHPIRIANDPPSWEVAATTRIGTPRVLSRSAWGADGSLLYAGQENTRSDADAGEEPAESAPTTVSKRVQDCLDAQRTHPEQFKVQRTVTTDAAGNRYRWAQQYSANVSLLVVHHTALTVTGDKRSGVERMRALYQYHANNRGWGDVGYHFLIDEEGQIYEGRAGGEGVVGGHAYCNNIGSIGVSLMGNFDVEQPSQKQMQSLQWLLHDLSRQYGIDPTRSVQFHGKRMDAIVGHRDLLSTDCPGYYAYGVLDQVRSHVIAGDLDGAVRFPVLATKDVPVESRVAERLRERLSTLSSSNATSGLSAVGSTTIEGRPGGTHVFLVHLDAGDAGLARRTRVADIRRSNPRIGLWQEIDGRDVRVRDELILPDALRAGQSATLRLRVQLPSIADSYTLHVGDLTYTFAAKGRRARPTAAIPATTTSTTARRASQAIGIVSRRTLSTDNSPARTSSSGTPSATSDDGPSIRIRLSHDASYATVHIPSGTQLGRASLRAEMLSLAAEGGDCVARRGSAVIDRGIVRLEAGRNVLEIASWTTPSNRFRGTLECRVIGNQLALINELPLETYLRGLAEEPDTEPYEKQRAFAVAARSYAAHYIDHRNRKFPGMPYDGDDSPARFQKYGGVLFEERNPGWVRAVNDTAHLVLTAGNGDIVKTAYFSSNDGRTRSPAENGWKNYPHAQFFASKPDPWCAGLEMRGHGVGMSGCGAKGQALEGKSAEEILAYYYAGAALTSLR